MDEFHINFKMNIFGKYGDFKKEKKAAKREKQNCVGLANYISLLKNTNKWTVTNKL